MMSLSGQESAWDVSVHLMVRWRAGSSCNLVSCSVKPQTMPVGRNCTSIRKHAFNTWENWLHEGWFYMG
jgi:hypothetical protein